MKTALRTLSVIVLALSLAACAGGKKQMKCEMAPEAKAEVAKQAAAKETTEKAEAAPKPELATNYVVKSGDSLERISRKKEVYGDGKMWPVIFEANRGKLKTPSTIYPGQALRIPRDPEEIAILKKRAISNRVRQMASPAQKPVPAKTPAAPQASPAPAQPAVPEQVSGATSTAPVATETVVAVQAEEVVKETAAAPQAS